MAQLGFRVLSMDPVRRVWVVRDDHPTMDSARIQADAILATGRRVRVVPATKKRLRVKPPVHSETRRHREQRMMEMSDRADANKRYKSPG